MSLSPFWKSYKYQRKIEWELNKPKQTKELPNCDTHSDKRTHQTKRNFENSSSREINLQLLTASTITFAIRIIFSFIRVLLLVSETFECKIFNSIGNFGLAS